MFPTTNWSSILAAHDGDWASVQDALQSLCERYHPAIVAYFRLKRRSYQAWAHVQDAEDLAHSFLAHLLEARRLQEFDPRKVRRFRHYLITALRNFLNDWVASQRAQKRGEGRQPVPLHELGALDGIDLPGNDPDLASALSRTLAINMHRRTMERLKDEAGDPVRFERLRRFILVQPQGGDYASAAADLGMTQDAVKTAVSRWLRRYAALFLHEFSPLVANDPGELREEVRDMLQVLNEAAEAGNLDL